MPDRTINWGDPADAGTKYRTQDDDPAGGGNFVVAEDTDGSTVLLQWNPTAGQWEYGGPVDMGGNDITNAGSISADALEAATINSNFIYAGNQDGSDPDARLDNALSAASAGDLIILEQATYTTDRSINNNLEIRGPSNTSADSAVIDATWTLTANTIQLEKLRIDTNGEIIISSRFCTLTELSCPGQITVQDDDNKITDVTTGSVTFESDTSNGIVDASTGVSVTDNGTNTVGDIA